MTAWADINHNIDLWLAVRCACGVAHGADQAPVRATGRSYYLKTRGNRIFPSRFMGLDVRGITVIPA
jgi:hypothetical protein